MRCVPFWRSGWGDAGGRHYLLALEEDHRANIARNADIRRQAMSVIATLNAAGIEPAALKGTRVILAGESPFAGARMLRDIDLVVPGDGWERAQTALGDAGYRRVGEAAHAAGFTHPDGGVELDLHRRPLSLHQPLPLPDYLTEEGFWRRTKPLDLAGLGCRQLPPAENLVHLILHTEIADLNFAAGDWALRYLYETAVITRTENSGLDWAVLDDLACRRSAQRDEGASVRRPAFVRCVAARGLCRRLGATPALSALPGECASSAVDPAHCHPGLQTAPGDDALVSRQQGILSASGCR